MNDRVRYPCVIKPVGLSGSRGVMRANTPVELAAAAARLRALLSRKDVRAIRSGLEDTRGRSGYGGGGGALRGGGGGSSVILRRLDRTDGFVRDEQAQCQQRPGHHLQDTRPPSTYQRQTTALSASIAAVMTPTTFTG